MKLTKKEKGQVLILLADVNAKMRLISLGDGASLEGGAALIAKLQDLLIYKSETLPDELPLEALQAV